MPKDSRLGEIVVRYKTAFAALGMGLVSPAFGHHSDAALDMRSVVTFEGTVTEYSLRNPHTYFTVETTNVDGERIEWSVQMASALTVSRRGWTRDTLLVGDQVRVGVHPALC